MKLNEALKVAEKIAAFLPKKGLSTNNEFDIFFEPQAELLKLEKNLMPIIGPADANTIDVFSNFRDKLEKLGGDKLASLESFDIQEGFHASPAGLSQLVFINRQISEERIRRAFLVLLEEKKNSLVFGINNSELKFKIDKKKVSPAFRTLTNMDSFFITGREDFLIRSGFSNFDSVLSLSKWKKKDTFNWGLVNDKAAGKDVHLVVARRFRPNSKNTHFFAFYSDAKFITPHTFKIINLSKKESKLQSLFLNSVVGLLDIVQFREQTTEGYTDIMESDLRLFTTISSKKLTKKDMKLLDGLFNEIKKVSFPSILEQLETRFWARVKLDETILKILGFSDRQIGIELPRVYKALVKELKAI